MEKTKSTHRALVSVATAAMVYLFFHQAHIALKPVPVAFEGTQIAYGYSVSTFTGTVYHDEGQTAVSSGSGVALHINGTASKTTTTNASGQYTFTNVNIFAHDVVTVFIDNENGDGVLVAKYNSGAIDTNTITGMDIYKDRLILRTSTSDLNVTTNDLDVANNAGDADVDAVYTIDGTTLQMKKGKELYVWSSTTHTTSGNILTHDLEVKGTLTMASSADITASGSFVIPGTITTTGDVTLTSVDSGETLQVNGTSLNNLYVDSGIEANYRMDEGDGTSLASATFNTATGGTITGPTWVQTNTGTTVLFNPFALEFDGSDDYVTFGDAFDIDDSTTKRTFATWFRRKSSDTEDVIFAKKAGSGSSTTGYMLWIDDATDALNFEVANGSSNYLVTSNSTVTDQNWHHVAVSYDPLDVDAINIFLDGAIDVSAKSGGLQSGNEINGTFSNSSAFQLGLTATSSGAFHGTLDEFRIYKRALSGSELSLLGAGQRTTGSGTYDLRSNIDVDGDFCVYAGVLDVGTGHTINVGGDFCTYGGELRTNSGTITLDGSDQAIRGSTAFNQLAKTNTTAVTLTFEVNTQQSVSGALTLVGALSNQMELVSTRTGSQSYLVVEDSGATLLTYLDVIDNNANSGALLVCSEGCIDSTNNDNWIFSTECGDGLVGTGEQCDDGDSDNNDTCPNDCQLPVCGDNIIEGLEECEPPNSGTCQSNCLERGAGGGGTNISAASTASFFKRPDPPDGCGNAILETEKGEECDAGTRFNGLGTCSFDCKKLICGDGVISPQIGEDCEPKLRSETNGVKIFEVATCGDTCSAPEVTPQGTLVGGCKRLFLQPCGAQSSSATRRPSAPSRCGNGTVDPGEECDFGGICTGGTFDGSFWTDAESVRTCTGGGGTATPTSGDGCSDRCLSEFCGDGLVQQRGADNQPGTDDDEQCDNGSVCSNDANKSCRLNAECGIGGTCDYNAQQDKTCSTTCKSTARPAAPTKQPICGNGTVDPGEECDGGSACTELCTRIQVAETPAPPAQPRCGDGIVQNEEQCDQGERNSDITPDACRTNCRLPSCGDFVVDSREQCDNGDGNSDFFPDSCRTNCSLPYCGDGVADSGEECDGSLSCLPGCTMVLRGRCGNTVVETGEQCDDGNTQPGDGCSAFCQKEILQAPESECGNGVLEEGEQCDDGNTEDGDECSSSCRSIEPVKASAPELVIDADVVVVNPDEYANALKFLERESPCSVLIIKGRNQKALMIRAAAVRQDIPVIRNIQLARSLYATASTGEEVFGELCTEINKLKPGYIEPAAPVAPEQPLPQAPTQFAYGFYNYAQVQPMITANPPAGDTGPALIGVAIAGAASGMGWMRRKKK